MTELHVHPFGLPEPIEIKPKKNKIDWPYTIFMAVMLFFISLSVMWVLYLILTNCGVH